MEVHDQSSSSKFTTANTMPNSIQTLMSTGCPIPTTSSISKSASNSLNNHVDSYIQLPLEKTTSYHQAQTFQMIQNPGGVNHNNLQVLTSGNSSFANYGASSSASKMVDQSLPIPSGAALSSVIDPKSQSSKIKTGYVSSRKDLNKFIQNSETFIMKHHNKYFFTSIFCHFKDL
jgi:hypothetical protein